MNPNEGLKKFFNTRALTSHELGLIEFVLNSQAYTECFKPYLENIRDSMQRQWLDRSQTRKDDYPDDTLAGGVMVIEGLLKFFDQILQETKFDRIHESMATMVPEKQYEMMRQQGKIHPIVGVDQNPNPQEYKPEEDF
jgi:hypothetical protein